MNWKFWTWPGQIRELRLKLATANEVIERQRKTAELELRKQQEAAYERHRYHRGQHRANL